MADRETWARRVAEWKASGLSSPAFCAGKDFTAGGLRHWAHRIAHPEERRLRVRVARVVRTSKRQASPVSADAPADLVVEVGVARVVVRSGFDRSVLAAVLEELLAAATRSAR